MARLRPGYWSALAAALALAAGALMLLGAWAGEQLPPRSAAGWGKLMLGLGFAGSGILQLMARRRIIRRIARHREESRP